MKLVKESLYDFERGIDPLRTLGIGRIGKIEKLFRDLGVEDSSYTITPDGVIFNSFLNLRDANISWLPAGLEVKGFLDIKGTKITKLPDNLIIGNTLCINNTQITELPKGLSVGHNLWLLNTLITELPDDLEVKYSILVSPDQKELIAFIENSEFADKLKFWK